MRALQEGTREKMVVSMVPAFPSGKIPHIPTFMSIHPAFSRAQQFLDQLLTRCCPPSIRSDAIQVFATSGNMQPYNDQGDTPQDQLKKAVASVMGAWPDQIQYVGQPLLLPWFTLKQALVQGHLPASHPLGHVLSLWVELEQLEPTEAELEEAPPEPQRAPEPEEGPAQGPVPGPALQQEPPAPPALIRMPTAEPAPCPAPDHPPAGTTKHLIKEEKRNILSFPPRLVAEQLTVMDALPHRIPVGPG
ncbi:ral guanine nucleotide dissociation stimulator-like [Molossus molossus]|uniref:ral guanine nucleotide dissociation stimulator-like n=1 Tax=Molossus molossus TaxID=27622 RepID=UPI0017475D71|nr:ral guanine nucleotide dissociation stimulator-like [Molossus molossus]